jgi:hypothetical protein
MVQVLPPPRAAPVMSSERGGPSAVAQAGRLAHLFDNGRMGESSLLGIHGRSAADGSPGLVLNRLLDGFEGKLTSSASPRRRPWSDGAHSHSMVAGGFDEMS